MTKNFQLIELDCDVLYTPKQEEFTANILGNEIKLKLFSGIFVLKLNTNSEEVIQTLLAMEYPQRIMLVFQTKHGTQKVDFKNLLLIEDYKGCRKITFSCNSIGYAK